MASDSPDFPAVARQENRNLRFKRNDFSYSHRALPSPVPDFVNSGPSKSSFAARSSRLRVSHYGCESKLLIIIGLVAGCKACETQGFFRWTSTEGNVGGFP